MGENEVISKGLNNSKLTIGSKDVYMNDESQEQNIMCSNIIRTYP